MRVKHILSLFAFAAALIVSVAIVAATVGITPSRFQTPRFQSDETTRQNITRFLQQDIQNGRDRDRSAYSYSDEPSLSSPNILKRASAVSSYADESGSMDFSRLPQDFQLSWLKHMRAWHNYADFLQKAKMQRMSYAEISQLENQYNREINLTWFETLRVARRYGAYVSEY